MPRTLADPSPQLSLWADEATANDEGAETAPPDSPAACDPPALPRTAQPEVPRPALPSAAPQPAPQPAAGAPIASVLLPATFRHPQANRESRLDGHHVAYLFRRMRRKTIGFSVGADGLVVSAPRWVAAGEVDSALQEKSRWVLAKLQEQAERAQVPAGPRPRRSGSPSA